MELTANEAQYVLSTLLKQGKLRATHIRAALRVRREEIRQLRERLAALEASAGAAVAPARSAAKRRPAARRRKLSRRVRNLRRLQGRYMGLVRRLKSAEKAKIRSVREKQGMLAAIRLAASLAQKS
jgi:hypothetical protein